MDKAVKIGFNNNNGKNPVQHPGRGFPAPDLRDRGAVSFARGRHGGYAKTVHSITRLFLAPPRMAGWARVIFTRASQATTHL